MVDQSSSQMYLYQWSNSKNHRFECATVKYTFEEQNFRLYEFFFFLLFFVVFFFSFLVYFFIGKNILIGKIYILGLIIISKHTL